MTHLKTQLEKSGKEFEKEIMCRCDGEPSNHTISNPERIKSFLSSSHKSLLLALVEDLEERKMTELHRVPPFNAFGYGATHEEGYNNALSSLQSDLREIVEKIK